MPQADYIIGTRGSLLAVTQSTITKNLLEQKTGKSFTIKTIKTQGDVQTDKPLWQYDGKDFFTKELDEALLKKEIDLVIHSYKDLGSIRPQGITLAAITQRSFSHDILLIKEKTIEKFNELEDFVVGTSSPRRITNIESSLKDYLPANEKLSVRCEMLRGNVNTRIQKLQDDKYHAIVLAFAGLERLCQLNESKAKLKELLKGLNFMILPQSQFPSAASQGALGIECLESNQELIQILSHIHDAETAETVQIERELFQSFGGGCHLAVGIHAKKFQKEHFICLKGEHEENKIQKRYLTHQKLEDMFQHISQQNVFIGLSAQKMQNKKNFVYDELLHKKALSFKLEKGICSFVTSTYSCENYDNPSGYTFSSGNKTWKTLAKKKIWVNGSSDSFGHQQILDFKQSSLLDLFFQKKKWNVLSHKDSQSDVGEIIESYQRVVGSASEEFLQKLSQVKVFFWTSFYQYSLYQSHIKDLEGVIHCCGAGKTLEQFVQNKIEVIPIVDMVYWQSLFK